MTLVPPTAKVVSESSVNSKRTASELGTSSSKKASGSVDPSHTVRTSSRDQKLDKHRYHNTSTSLVKKAPLGASTVSPLASIVFPRQIKLSSIEALRQSIDEQCDTDLLNILRNFVYVGTIDGQSSLIQHETQLYLVHTRHLSQELFYQLCIYHFGNLGTIRLEPESPSIEVEPLALIVERAPIHLTSRNSSVSKPTRKK
jgi:DNA mismatch repair ATPase MutL